MQTLLDSLLALEKELHQNDTRKNRSRLESLLHPEFIEIGRSGRIYSRQDILKEFETENSLPVIEVNNAEVREIREGIAILTYTSNHKTDSAHRFTLRSSLWERIESRWVLRFYQGTAVLESN